jgi:hypothetical protein
MPTPQFERALANAEKDIHANLAISDDKKASLVNGIRNLASASQDQVRHLTDDDGFQLTLVLRVADVRIDKDHDTQQFDFQSRGKVFAIARRPNGHTSVIPNILFDNKIPLGPLAKADPKNGILAEDFHRPSDDTLWTALPLTIIKESAYYNTPNATPYWFEGKRVDFGEKGGPLKSFARHVVLPHGAAANLHASALYFEDEPNPFGSYSRLNPHGISASTFQVMGVSPEHAKSLSKAIEDARFAPSESTLEAALKHQNQRFERAGVDMGRVDQYAFKSDPQIINFLMNAPTDTALRYRAEYLIRANTMLRASGQDEELQFAKSTYNNLAFNFIGHGHSVSTALEQIDQGIFPAKEICRRQGFHSISKKQFSKAMRWLGTQHPSGMSALSGRTLSHHLAMAKIPDEWLTLGNGKHLLDPHARLPLSDDSIKTLNKALPSLLNAGKEIDKLTLNNDKPAQKALAAKWAWLRGSAPLEQKVQAFDQKYQINASMSDYASILNTCLESVMFRAINDHPAINNDLAFEVDEDAFDLSLNSSCITEDLKQAAYEAVEELPAYYDEDFEEWVEQTPDEVVGDLTLDVPDVHDLKHAMFENVPEFTSAAKQNHALHKHYSTFVRQANENTKHNYTWTPLVDHPINLGDNAVATCIDNRLDLLLEGSEMDHCVFSYINACLAGESVIFSVRDKHTDARLATVELKTDEDDEGRTVFSIAQCYGHNNRTNEHTDAIERDMDSWVAMVNDGVVPTNAEQLQDNAEHIDDIIDTVNQDKGANGEIMCTLPYNNDAAYLAYYIFNTYSPEGTSVNEVLHGLGNGYEWAEVFKSSGFTDTINTIEALAASCSQDPMTLIAHKIKHNITNWNEIPAHQQRLHDVSDGLQTLVDSYDGTLSVAQLHLKCILYATEHHIDIGDPEALRQQLKSGRLAPSALGITTKPVPLDPNQLTQRPGETYAPRMTR